MQAKENLTTHEAAQYLRTSARTLIRWRAERIGPKFTRAGGKVLYRQRDLAAYLDGHTVEPVAEVAA